MASLVFNSLWGTTRVLPLGNNSTIFKVFNKVVDEGGVKDKGAYWENFKEAAEAYSILNDENNWKLAQVGLSYYYSDGRSKNYFFDKKVVELFEGILRNYDRYYPEDSKWKFF